MRYHIQHAIPGRVRITLGGNIDAHDALILEDLLLQSGQVTRCLIYARTGSVALFYGGAVTQQQVLALVDALTIEQLDTHTLSEVALLAQQVAPLWEPLARLVLAYLFKRYCLPAPLRAVLTVFDALSFVRDGLKSLLSRHLDVPVLDAAAIGVSLVKQDYTTAGSTMLLLKVSETLESYTRDRSKAELIYSLFEVPEKVWLVQGEHELLVTADELAAGDVLVVRTGSPIPTDGVVLYGEALVNQSTLTGEERAVLRSQGDDVFAGTAVEEGELYLRVRATTTETRLRSIVRLVEQSEALKSDYQFRMEHLADRFVPWNFLLAGIVWLATRSLEKLSAALMVDYSCALKLSGSIAVLAAQREAAQCGYTVKGSRYFEAMAQADTIVFDKTGTLTVASPQVCDVLAFDGWERDEVLRLAACLEEHFPHPVARAVVNQAAREGLSHREYHAEVEYLVAHGIVSGLNGKRVIIGSGHFVFEDEGVPIDSATHTLIEQLTGEVSLLYLAVDHQLVGAICIADPAKSGLAATIAALKDLGYRRIIMLTGDGRRAASRIAKEAGITEFYADLLPEDKHAFLAQLKAQGNKVVMVGDGVNDSPALSQADVGIAMGDGAAIAREVADITLATGDLNALVDLRRLSNSLLARMDNSYRFTMVLNSALLALGIGGALQPQTSSLIHNASTVATSISCTRSYLA